MSPGPSRKWRGDLASGQLEELADPLKVHRNPVKAECGQLEEVLQLLGGCLLEWPLVTKGTLHEVCSSLHMQHLMPSQADLPD